MSCIHILLKHAIIYFTLASFPAPNNTKLKNIHQEIESTWKNIANFLSGSAILVCKTAIVINVKMLYVCAGLSYFTKRVPGIHGVIKIGTMSGGGPTGCSVLVAQYRDYQ